MSTVTSTKATTQADTLAQLQALISGLQKQLPSGSFTLVSTVYTTPALVTALQGTVATLVAVTTAHAALKVALAAYDAEDAKMGPVILALRRTLESMYANAPDTLALFGMEARKVPAPRTSAERAASAAKAAATRKARGTASPKAKSAITGNVTGVNIVPITAPPAAAAPAQPVSAAPAPPVATPPATPVVTSAAPASPTGHVGQ
jgi:hypothetical protein